MNMRRLMRWTALRWTCWALLAAAPARGLPAQEMRGLTFEQLLGLVEGGVPTGTILTTVQSDCLAFFTVSPEMERSLQQGGAEPRLVDGLRSVCRVFPEGIVAAPFESWILVGEPAGWGGEEVQAVAVDAGTLLRVAGRAFAPSGVDRIEVGGVRAQLMEDPGRGTRFSAELRLEGGADAVEVVLHPEQGAPVRRALPVSVTVAETPAPPVTPPPAEPQTQVVRRVYDPTSVALSGLLLPGLAQFRTDNTELGVVILSAAGTALLAGLLSTETRIRCAANADPCPPGAVLSETSSRPYVALGLAATVVVSAVGAALGYQAAKAANEAQPPFLGSRPRGTPAGAGAFLARLLPEPRAERRHDGALRLELARLRF